MTRISSLYGRILWTALIIPPPLQVQDAQEAELEPSHTHLRSCMVCGLPSSCSMHPGAPDRSAACTHHHADQSVNSCQYEAQCRCMIQSLYREHPRQASWKSYPAHGIAQDLLVRVCLKVLGAAAGRSSMCSWAWLLLWCGHRAASRSRLALWSSTLSTWL